MSSETTVFEYVGNGAYLDGVPARDLTKADLDQIGPYLAESVEASDLYRPIAAREKAKKAPADLPAPSEIK